MILLNAFEGLNSPEKNGFEKIGLEKGTASSFALRLLGLLCMTPGEKNNHTTTTRGKGSAWDKGCFTWQVLFVPLTQEIFLYMIPLITA
jgi:hypothetical protein